MGHQRHRWLAQCWLGISVALSSAATIDFADAKDQIVARPRTYLDLKYEYTVRQQRDFTCGSAALATLLKYHYGMPVTEEMLFTMIADRYKPSEFKKKAEIGLSFEDLIFVAEQLGFQAQAARMEAAELEKLNGPILMQLDWKEFDHFSVLRKKTPDLAYFSDPILGQITLDNEEFLKKFKGPVLAVWPAYVKGDYFSGLNVIRDPISVSRDVGRYLTPDRIHPRIF
jgi:uncharacterized protein